MTIVGRAWIKGSWKPIYQMREIRRGRFKGWHEVTYLAGYQRYRKVKLKDGVKPDEMCST